MEIQKKKSTQVREALEAYGLYVVVLVAVGLIALVVTFAVKSGTQPKVVEQGEEVSVGKLNATASPIYKNEKLAAVPNPEDRLSNYDTYEFLVTLDNPTKKEVDLSGFSIYVSDEERVEGYKAVFYKWADGEEVKKTKATAFDAVFLLSDGEEISGIAPNTKRVAVYRVLLPENLDETMQYTLEYHGNMDLLGFNTKRVKVEVSKEGRKGLYVGSDDN